MGSWRKGAQSLKEIWKSISFSFSSLTDINLKIAIGWNVVHKFYLCGI